MVTNNTDFPDPGIVKSLLQNKAAKKLMILRNKKYQLSVLFNIIDIESLTNTDNKQTDLQGY